jgi:hypothetical protein
MKMPIWAFSCFAILFFCDKISYAKAEKREYNRDGGFRNDTQIFLFGSSHHPDSFNKFCYKNDAFGAKRPFIR